MTKQRSFASLTEEEINQVAEWLQHGTYDEVRDRIAKPRPEGFGLNLKSKRPLETLWQNKNTVDRINRKLAQGEKLTVSEFNAINSGERADLPEKIQDVIMETTYELATSGENNPTQLLALQRLADFPPASKFANSAPNSTTKSSSTNRKWTPSAKAWPKNASTSPKKPSPSATNNTRTASPSHSKKPNQTPQPSTLNPQPFPNQTISTV